MISYLTEDHADSGVHSFVPDDANDPLTCRLQALQVLQRDRFDTSSGLRVGNTFDIAWVDIEDSTPSGDTVRQQGQGRDAVPVYSG